MASKKNAPATSSPAPAPLTIEVVELSAEERALLAHARRGPSDPTHDVACLACRRRAEGLKKRELYMTLGLLGIYFLGIFVGYNLATAVDEA